MKLLKPLLLIAALTLWTNHGFAAPFSFLAYGDNRSGGAPDCSANAIHIGLINRMVNENAPFVFNLGDMVTGYSNTTNWVQNGACTGAANYGSLKNMITPLQNKTPPPGVPASFIPVIGNHDDNWGDSPPWYPDAYNNGYCDVFDARALIPNHTQAPWFGTGRPKYTDANFYSLACSVTDKSVYPRYMYFSFDYQNSHFIVMRLNNEYDDLEACNNCNNKKNYDDYYNIHQLDWLRTDLAATAAKPSIQNIFVFLHVPVFTTSDGHTGSASATALSREFSKYKVKIVFSSHNHVYERTVPILAPATSAAVRDDANGTVYVVSGGGGSDPHGFRAAQWFDAKRTVENHYVRVDVDGTTVSVRVINKTGAVIDSFVMAGDGSVPPLPPPPLPRVRDSP